MCCGFILERRGVCRGKVVGIAMGRRYVVKETEEKVGENPFLAPKNRKKGVNVVRRPRQRLRASMDMCNAR